MSFARTADVVIKIGDLTLVVDSDFKVYKVSDTSREYYGLFVAKSFIAPCEDIQNKDDLALIEEWNSKARETSGTLIRKQSKRSCLVD
jgi:hypothetical protein